MHPLHPLERAARTDLDRRALLRMLGGAGAIATAGGAAALLTACSTTTATSGAPAAAGGTTSTSARVRLGATGSEPAASVAAIDPSQPYWLQGNFAPVFEERTATATQLVVEGALPRELSGLYVRNGSNPATGTSPHWFLGDGMVHGIRLADGKAEWYRNRYVATPMYEHRTNLDKGSAPGGASSQSNVSIFQHAGKLLTSGEVGYPYELTPELATTGVYDFGGRLKTSMTAHPKIDPATGEMHFFGYGFVPPYLTYHVAAADGTLRHSEEVSVPAPLMIHDFAITERDAIFWALPVVFSMPDALRMVKGEKVFPFRWDPSVPSRIGVMPLGGPASSITWVDIDPCFVFHGTNAYRDGSKVVVDVCRLPSVFKDGGDLERSATHRWTIDLPAGGAAPTFTDHVLTDAPMDLPGIDRRHVGRRHRYGWYAAIDQHGPNGLDMAGVNRLDHDTGELQRWDPGPDYRAGEVVFVPASPGAGEGEGWVLCFAYDRTRDSSDFVVLDATDVASGPVARVRLPGRVPYGFHGWWVADT